VELPHSISLLKALNQVASKALARNKLLRRSLLIRAKSNQIKVVVRRRSNQLRSQHHRLVASVQRLNHSPSSQARSKMSQAPASKDRARDRTSIQNKPQLSHSKTPPRRIRGSGRQLMITARSPKHIIMVVARTREAVANTRCLLETTRAEMVGLVAATMPRTRAMVVTERPGLAV